MEQEIIIASDGSKSKSKSGGVWLIADSSGSSLISWSNHNFGPITSMNSYRSEIYGVLSALLFLNEYCRYYVTPLISQVNYFYTNLEVVKKWKS